MKNFIKKSPTEIRHNFFKLFEVNWGLLVAGQLDDFNIMTISWGETGILWNKNVCTVYVRPTRYTFEYMENESFFTVNFMGDGKYKKALEICGTYSGRTADKLEMTGLTPGELEKGQIFLQEAELSIVCRKIYWQDLNPKNFLSPSIHQVYGNSDYHRMYIGEILTVLKKQ